MASWETTAFINNIRYLPDSVIVYLDEYHNGYTKADGTIIEEKYVSFKTIWKPYFKSFISKHFGNGMLVNVKGDMLPYAVEKGKTVDGYTIIGQCINLASYPRYSVKQEQTMIKESQANDPSVPDLRGYFDPDF